MKKLMFALTTITISQCFADTGVSGFYLGGGLGYGIQKQDYQNSSTSDGSLGLRIQLGYQFADWIGAELGYNYITEGSNWNNLGSPSSSIYDLGVTPGFIIPATPIGVFVRLGVNAVSPNLNSSFYNSSMNSSVNFEYGAGVKIDLPETKTFIRAEYINYGGGPNNGNSGVLTTPSAILVDAAYVF